MSITDELRDWKGNINTRLLPETVLALRSELNCIADRIDAEHEAKVAYWQEASHRDGYDEGFASADDWLGQHEDAMADHGWIRLPVDADGKYIHIGDVMVYADGNTCPMKVVALVPPSVFLTDDGPRYADMCRHKPTLQEALDENTKLRELVRKVEHYEQYGCHECPHHEGCDAHTLYDVAKCTMQLEIDRDKLELGIEVDDA